MRRVSWGLAGLVGLALVVRAPAGGEGDKDFLAKAIAAQIAEIKLAELADRQAQSAEVKGFAKHMITDHTKLRDQLLDRAKAMKLAVVQGLEKDYKDKMERLSKLEGADFDKQYMAEMVKDHQKALKDFEAQSKSAQDQELRRVLTDALPRIREHLKHAQQVARDLK